MTRTAIITGASGGIGVALCATFRNAGYRVLALDRRPVGRCPDTYYQIDCRRLSTPTAERADFLAFARDWLEDTGLTVLLNNAAVQILSPTERVTLEDWEETLHTNLLAPFFLVQDFLPALEKARGSVVNIASIHALATKPEFVAYSTSKAALVGVTRALAVDLGGRVRVNALLPAAVATPMLLAGFEDKPDEYERLCAHHPVGRIGIPEEVAATALFLASDQAHFVTGAAWTLDGGIGGRLHDPV